MRTGRTAAALGAMLAFGVLVAGCTSDGPSAPSSTASTGPAPFAVGTLAPSGAAPTALGAPLWTAASNPEHVIVHGDTTVLFDENGTVTAVRTSNGRPLWRYRLIGSTGEALRDGRGARLYRVAGEQVVVVESRRGPLVVVGYRGGPDRDGDRDDDSGVAALRLDDGSVAWTNPLGHRDGESQGIELAQTHGGAVVLNQGVYGELTKPSDIRVLGLDPATGRVRWQERGSRVDTVAGDTVVTVSQLERDVPRVGHDLTTGAVRWRVSEDRFGGTHSDAPTTRTLQVGDGVLAADTGRLVARVPLRPYDCESDGARLVACLDGDDRLLTLEGTERTLSAAVKPLRPSEYRHYEIALVADGRVWLHDDHAGTSFAVDRTGATVVSAVRGTVLAAAGAYVVVRGAGGRTSVHRLG